MPTGRSGRRTRSPASAGGSVPTPARSHATAAFSIRRSPSGTWSATPATTRGRRKSHPRRLPRRRDEGWPWWEAVPRASRAPIFAARLGHGVTIFEAEEAPGGMLRRAIPEYRLPADVLRWEIGQVLSDGRDAPVQRAAGERLFCGGPQGIRRLLPRAGRASRRTDPRSRRGVARRPLRPRVPLAGARRQGTAALGRRRCRGRREQRHRCGPCRPAPWRPPRHPLPQVPRRNAGVGGGDRTGGA